MYIVGDFRGGRASPSLIDSFWVLYSQPSLSLSLSLSLSILDFGVGMVSNICTSIGLHFRAQPHPEVWTWIAGKVTPSIAIFDTKSGETNRASIVLRLPDIRIFNHAGILLEKNRGVP